MPPRNPNRVFSIILALLSGLLLLLQACGPNPTEAPPATATPTGSASKIDSLLLEIFLRYTTATGTEADKQKVAIDFAREQGVINKKNEVQFELELDDPARVGPVGDKVKSMGGRVIDSPNIEGTVNMRVAVPVNTFITYANSTTKENFLKDLADFQGVKNIRIIVGNELQELRGLPETREALSSLYQSAKNEGVKLMGADKWQAAGFNGKGVKIGVIDGGFKYYQEFLGKTLPANLTIRDQNRENGEDGTIDESVHGTAVLEILYSLAPAAEFYAVSIDPVDNEIASAIDYLVAQGVNIISMSLGGHGSSGEGIEPFNQKIDRVRKEKGVLFFISAGNEGDAHYAGLFDPDPQGFQQWQPGVTKMAIGNFSGVPFDSYVILNWEQWRDKTRTDLDLYIEDKDGKPVVSSSNDQRVREPREYARFTIKPGTIYYVKARLKPNATPPTKPFRLHIFTHDLPVQFFTPVLSVANPADSKGAFAVGAVQWNKDNIAYYSSQGPLPNGLFKPELSAPAGVSSAAYAEDGEDRFDGTSAACPEAAGLAAVIKSANLKLSADELSQVILQSVKDLGDKGPDTAYGYGRSDLSSLAPGDVRLKGTLVAPAPNPDPELNVKTLGRFPSPVVSSPGTAQPTATKIAATTAPPAPTATIEPPTSKTFRDDFQSADSGLPNSGPTLYENGAYRIKANPNQLVWGVYPGAMQVGDFAAEVKVQGISNGNGLYGLVFWLQSPTNYYLLSVSGGGQFQISQFNQGQWKELIGWNAAPGWKNDSQNTISLVASNNQLSVRINSQPTGQTAQAQSSGAIGFAAGSYSQPVNAAFSDFKLTTRG